MMEQPEKNNIEQELTRYKQIEKSLQQRNQELALINKATQAFNSSLNIDEVLRAILDEMHQLMDILSTSFWLQEPDTGHLVCQHTTGPGQEDIIGWRLASGQGITGYAAQTGQTIIIADTRTDTRHFKVIDQKIGVELRSLLCLPLKVKQDVIGVLNLADTKPGRFSTDDLSLLEPIAAAAANATQNARLFKETQRQRRLAEQRLEELAFLNQIAQTLATITHLQSALELTAQIITYCFNGFSTGISIFNQARTHRTIATMYQIKDAHKLNLVGQTTPITNDITYLDYISQGKTLIIPDPQSSPYTESSRQSIIERNLQCLMLVPLQTRGEIIGSISISTNQVGRIFTPQEIELAKTIAGQIAGAIEVARLFEEEYWQRQLVENRNQELDAFARTVAHDLKNPLTTIVGYTELLLVDPGNFEPQEFQEVYHIIHRSTLKLLTIIDELLLLAGVRHRAVPLTPIDMKQIMAQVQERLASMIETYQATLTLPDTWPPAKGYAPWIEEVWVNYISNGLKYGGESPRLKIGAISQPDGMVRFWVTDNGPGIPIEAQTTLFKEFTRLDRQEVEGHGLGLSIVRRIIEKLKGQVGVESSGIPGQGSTFYFTLPGADKDDIN